MPPFATRLATTLSATANRPIGRCPSTAPRPGEMAPGRCNHAQVCVDPAYSLRLGRPNPHQVKLLYSAGDPASREPAHDCGDEFTPVRPRGITSRGRSLANCSCREPDPDAAAGRSVRRGPGDRLRTRVAPGRDREGICSRNRRVRRATRVPVSRPFHCMEAKSCVANSARREVRGGWRTPPVMPEEPPAT